MNALKKLLELDTLKTKLQYKLCKNVNVLSPLYETFSKVEFDLLQKCTIKDENLNIKLYDEDDFPHRKGDPKFSPNKEIEFIREKNDLLQCENEVDVHLINIDEFPENIGEGTLLLSISFLIKDEE
jgi:hypothetical protein